MLFKRLSGRLRNHIGQAVLEISEILANLPHHMQVHRHLFCGLVGKSVVDHIAIDIKAIVIGDQGLSLVHGKLIA